MSPATPALVPVAADLPDEALRDYMRKMSHYRTYSGRAAYPGPDYGNGPELYDPYSTEGPNRACWHLSGYAHMGTNPDTGGRVYVLRFDVDGNPRIRAFVAADLNGWMHTSDDQPRSDRTLTAATRLARSLTHQPRHKKQEEAA